MSDDKKNIERKKDDISSGKLEQMINNRKAENAAFKKILRSLEKKVDQMKHNKNNDNES